MSLGARLRRPVDRSLGGVGKVDGAKVVEAPYPVGRGHLVRDRITESRTAELLIFSTDGTPHGESTNLRVPIDDRSDRAVTIASILLRYWRGSGCQGSGANF
jgi:hypothetical protein